MKIDISSDMEDTIISSSLREQFVDLSDYIAMRKAGSVKSVMFSHDIDEDLKCVKKLQKALRLVHNYYTVAQL